MHMQLLVSFFFVHLNTLIEPYQMKLVFMGVPKQMSDNIIMVSFC